MEIGVSGGGSSVSHLPGLQMVHSHGPSAPQKPSGKTEDAALGTCALVTSFKFSSLGKALSLNSHIVRHILVVRTST